MNRRHPEVALSDELRAALGAVFTLVHQAASKVLLPVRDKDAALGYLILLHQIIRASVPVMRFALAETRRRPTIGADKEQPLLDYLQKHILEETDHDKWLLDDLEAAGCSRDYVLSLPPPRKIVQLVGAQYYLIAHHHPIAILGYIALLESNPPSKELIDGIQARSGLRAEAFRTLRTHTEVDPHHIKELDALLDRLVLTRAEKQVLLTNAVQSCVELAASVDSVIPSVKKSSGRADAPN